MFHYSTEDWPICWYNDHTETAETISPVMWGGSLFTRYLNIKEVAFNAADNQLLTDHWHPGKWWLLFENWHGLLLAYISTKSVFVNVAVQRKPLQILQHTGVLAMILCIIALINLYTNIVFPPTILFYPCF